MDRRGSGIDRILRSYSDFDNKPIFYSEADYFLVTLPNRSIISGLSDVTTAQQNVVTSAQNVASLEKKVASSVVDVASNLKGSLSKEQELVEFISRIEKIFVRHICLEDMVQFQIFQGRLIYGSKTYR